MFCILQGRWYKKWSVLKRPHHLFHRIQSFCWLSVKGQQLHHLHDLHYKWKVSLKKCNFTLFISQDTYRTFFDCPSPIIIRIYIRYNFLEKVALSASSYFLFSVESGADKKQTPWKVEKIIRYLLQVEVRVLGKSFPHPHLQNKPDAREQKQVIISEFGKTRPLLLPPTASYGRRGGRAEFLVKSAQYVAKRAKIGRA